MEQIFVYGDSLSWGIIPDTRRRLPFEQRWPGVLEGALIAQGRAVRVLEDCLNGRRAVLEDPFKPGRNGLVGLAQRIEAQSPLALVILLLGTNDFQSMHAHNAWHAAQGMAALVAAIRQTPIEPGMPVPPILIVAPPPLGEPRGTIAPKFAGGDQKCAGLATAYRDVATALGCPFFDAGTVVAASKVDGVHLDADAHQRLGEALADPAAAILYDDEVRWSTSRQTPLSYEQLLAQIRLLDPAQQASLLQELAGIAREQLSRRQERTTAGQGR